MPTSETQVASVKIDRLVGRIKDGDIKIPAFQRGFVWDQEQIIALLDSIYNNYPVGSLLLWRSSERLKSTRNVAGLKLPDREPEYPVNYVLDGQQRLSSIYGVFSTDREFAEYLGAYAVDARVFDIGFDLVNLEFLPLSNAADPQRMIPLKSLFNPSEFLVILGRLSLEEQKLATELHTHFNNYEFPTVTVTHRDKREVGTIFERINSTGTKLTTLDLMVAWTWSEDFHLQEQINQLLDTLDEKRFGDLPEKTLLQSLSGMIVKSTKTRSILGLSPDDVRGTFESMTDAMERTIDFLGTEFSVASRELLPFPQQIVGLTYFFSKVTNPTASQLKLVRQWFWKTTFSYRYSAQTDEKMDADIEFFDGMIDGSIDISSDYKYDIAFSDIIFTGLSKSNPIARACLLLMAQRQPRDLTNGAAIDVGQALSSYNRKEYHHIFPKAFLRKRGIAASRINSMANICFLASSSNKKISSKPPSDYISSVVPQDEKKEILESNLMPLKNEVYSKDDYDQFLEERARIMIAYLDSLLL
ncbi:DUF262 domain-containing protein [bacterium]|nr:DUF262 domain-containing protein [bacterium]MBU1984957.1 DUF262 domain-containing protein [bacterium]